MERKRYYLGLDMGTASVGWAVTDMSYRLLRARGKDLWGVREFETAKTSAERRVNRTSRRRKQREVVRIGLLKDYFADAIENVDPNFYVRLENSKYYMEDKDEKLTSKFGIFADAMYTDKEYYSEYPTIFHLRKELIKNEHAPYDVRLVFLAILNMFKHRGHFLLNNVESQNDSVEISLIFDDLIETLTEEYEIEFPTGLCEQVIGILADKEAGRKAKSEKLVALFNVKKDKKRALEFIKCMSGLKVDGKVLFDIESEEAVSICFADYSYEETVAAMEAILGETNFAVLESMKRIYDYAALVGVLKGYEYLSEARVDDYDKHKKDLILLKSVYRRYKTEEDYDRMFRSDEKGTYGAFVNSNNTEGMIRRRNMENRSFEDLYKTIKKDLAGVLDEDATYILNAMEKEDFLPKQLTSANGIIPNQVHKKELVKILSNAEEYLPFLRECDESGLTVSERIIQLFSFQIPYYIGPIGGSEKFGWMVRREEGQILPWNMEQKIDVSKTAEIFIKNLIRSCTYLADEKVMPKGSLKYEKYCVLNEINNIKVNDERLDSEVKKKLYEDVFQQGKRVTKTKICKYLITLGVAKSEEEITGVDKNINNSLSSYGKMYAIFGERLKEDKYFDIAEEIIYYCTIFGDSKKMLKSKLLYLVKDGILQEKDLNRILGYKFKDWGRFSKELIDLCGIDYSTGEQLTLLQAMWEYSLNFMEIINSDAFSFKDELKKKEIKTLKTLSDFTYEDLDDYYFSSPVKRMIWQTILVIKEIESVMGCAPEKIFVEMTRSDEEKGDAGRKDSRGKELLNAYKDIKNTDDRQWKKEIEAADKDGKLRSKKIYLFYKQMGRDAYTGKPIPYEALFDDNLYDIDHIYPRRYVKDDSLANNLVLVNKAANEHLKKDVYPLPESIVHNQKVRELWDILHQKGLMNDEKYHRLTNRHAFTDEQLAGFIARQMVETGQGTRGLTQLLKQLMPEATIVYSKARNVSDFRRNGFPKSRLVNEFHHAHDAYLNVVVGNIYHVKFTSNPILFIQKEYNRDKDKNHYHLGKMIYWDIQRNGEVAWVAERKGKEGTMKTVRKMLSKCTPMVTKMPYVNAGTYYNATVYSKQKAKPDNYVPLKTKDGKQLDVTKYGGYTSLNPAYFIFIEYGKGKKRVKAFDVVPLLYANRIHSEEDLIQYCEQQLGYQNVKVICEKIKKETLFYLDGYLLYIAGLDSRKNVEFHNATSLCVGFKWIGYIHKIEKATEEGKIDKEITIEGNIGLYDLLIDKHCNSVLNKAPKPMSELLKLGRDKFIKLTLKEQVAVLYKLVQISSFKGGTVSLAEIGGPKENGRIRISGNMTNREKLILIEQSVTGLFEKRINLLKED